jgi:hypothetical protein
MKNFVCLFLILAAAVGNAFAQKTFDVQDFSKDYYGKVYLENPAEVFSKGWVAIYDKRNNRQLIKVESERMVSGAEEGIIKANVKELPYGEQSVIIYEDFNFDGVKDFAVMDGQNSCYGGPSFQIYLAGKIRGRFTLNKAFTRLAQDYCGMFEVDAKAKKISTMTKSGCCWHEFSEFIVAGNTPKVVKIVEDEADGYPFSSISTQTWKGNRKAVTLSRVVNLEDEDTKILLSFKTGNNGEVILFSYGNELNYAFANKAGNIDFAFPKDSKQDNPTFSVNSKENPTELSFTNKGVAYKVYELANDKIGVEVNAKGKLSDISGEAASRKGSLRNLVGENLTNVTFK